MSEWVYVVIDGYNQVVGLYKENSENLDRLETMYPINQGYVIKKFLLEKDA